MSESSDEDAKFFDVLFPTEQEKNESPHEKKNEDSVSPERKSRKEFFLKKRMEEAAANYVDYDQVQDSQQGAPEAWTSAPKQTKVEETAVKDYRTELELYIGSVSESEEEKPKPKKKRGGKKKKNKRKKLSEKSKMMREKFLKESAHRIVCSYFKQGNCRKGADCAYSHTLPKKIPALCKFYVESNCTKGEDCKYMHSEFPCKYFHTKAHCFAQDECRFSHEPLTDEMAQALYRHLNPRQREKEEEREEGEELPQKRACLLGDATPEMARSDETRRWREEMCRMQLGSSGFKIKVPKTPEKVVDPEPPGPTKFSFYRDTFADPSDVKGGSPPLQIQHLQDFYGGSIKRKERSESEDGDDHELSIDLPEDPSSGDQISLCHREPTPPDAGDSRTTICGNGVERQSPPSVSFDGNRPLKSFSELPCVLPVCATLPDGDSTNSAGSEARKNPPETSREESVSSFVDRRQEDAETRSGRPAVGQQSSTLPSNLDFFPEWSDESRPAGNEPEASMPEVSERSHYRPNVKMSCAEGTRKVTAPTTPQTEKAQTKNQFPFQRFVPQKDKEDNPSSGKSLTENAVGALSGPIPPITETAPGKSSADGCSTASRASVPNTVARDRTSSSEIPGVTTKTNVGSAAENSAIKTQEAPCNNLKNPNRRKSQKPPQKKVTAKQNQTKSNNTITYQRPPLPPEQNPWINSKSMVVRQFSSAAELLIYTDMHIVEHKKNYPEAVKKRKLARYRKMLEELQKSRDLNSETKNENQKDSENSELPTIVTSNADGSEKAVDTTSVGNILARCSQKQAPTHGAQSVNPAEGTKPGELVSHDSVANSNTKIAPKQPLSSRQLLLKECVKLENSTVSARSSGFSRNIPENANLSSVAQRGSGPLPERNTTSSNVVNSWSMTYSSSSHQKSAESDLKDMIQSLRPQEETDIFLPETTPDELKLPSAPDRASTLRNLSPSSETRSSSVSSDESSVSDSEQSPVRYSRRIRLRSLSPSSDRPSPETNSRRTRLRSLSPCSTRDSGSEDVKRPMKPNVRSPLNSWGSRENDSLRTRLQCLSPSSSSSKDIKGETSSRCSPCANQLSPKMYSLRTRLRSASPSSASDSSPKPINSSICSPHDNWGCDRIPSPQTRLRSLSPSSASGPSSTDGNSSPSNICSPLKDWGSHKINSLRTRLRSLPPSSDQPSPETHSPRTRLRSLSPFSDQPTIETHSPQTRLLSLSPFSDQPTIETHSPQTRLRSLSPFSDRPTTETHSPRTRLRSLSPFSDPESSSKDVKGSVSMNLNACSPLNNLGSREIDSLRTRLHSLSPMSTSHSSSKDVKGSPSSRCYPCTNPLSPETQSLRTRLRSLSPSSASNSSCEDGNRSPSINSSPHNIWGKDRMCSPQTKLRSLSASSVSNPTSTDVKESSAINSKKSSYGDSWGSHKIDSPQTRRRSLSPSSDRYSRSEDLERSPMNSNRYSFRNHRESLVKSTKSFIRSPVHSTKPASDAKSCTTDDKVACISSKSSDSPLSGHARASIPVVPPSAMKKQEKSCRLSPSAPKKLVSFCLSPPKILSPSATKKQDSSCSLPSERLSTIVTKRRDTSCSLPPKMLSPSETMKTGTSCSLPPKMLSPVEAKPLPGTSAISEEGVDPVQPPICSPASHLPKAMLDPRMSRLCRKRGVRSETVKKTDSN